MNISIAIPTYKNRKMTISNLKKNYRYFSGAQVVINDDVSGDDMIGEIKKLFPKIEVYENSKNLGFAGNMKNAINHCDGDYVLLLNTDVLLHDKSYLKGARFLRENKDYFAVSFRMKERGGEYVGRNKAYVKSGYILHKRVSDMSRGLNGWAEGGAMIMNKNYYNRLGKLQGIQYWYRFTFW